MRLRESGTHHEEQRFTRSFRIGLDGRKDAENKAEQHQHKDTERQDCRNRTYSRRGVPEVIHEAFPPGWPLQEIVHLALESRFHRFPLANVPKAIVEHLKEKLYGMKLRVKPYACHITQYPDF